MCLYKLTYFFSIFHPHPSNFPVNQNQTVYPPCRLYENLFPQSAGPVYCLSYQDIPLLLLMDQCMLSFLGSLSQHLKRLFYQPFTERHFLFCRKRRVAKYMEYTVAAKDSV